MHQRLSHAEGTMWLGAGLVDFQNPEIILNL